MADKNTVLFQKVKVRERQAALKRDAEILERNRQAEYAIKIENDRQKLTAMDMLAHNEPRGDKVSLPPLSEY